MKQPLGIILTTEVQNASENMATDWSMHRLLSATVPCVLRFYEWRNPAMSFGYFQRREAVEQAAATTPQCVEWVRRPTGGGIVDHRSGMTFALVLPRNRADATKISCLYHDLHNALSHALNELGETTKLSDASPQKSPPLHCFDQPVVSDIIDSKTGQKLAGSAIHRGRHRILVQGSIAAHRLTKSIPVDALLPAFSMHLSAIWGDFEMKPRPLSALKVGTDDVSFFESHSWTNRR